MDPITIGLGVVLLWSIVRPGWVYELGDRPMPLLNSKKDALAFTDDDHASRTFEPYQSNVEDIGTAQPRQTIRTDKVLSENERSEAAHALRIATRK